MVKYLRRIIIPHQQALDDGVPILAFIVHHLNVVQIGIGPVHQPADQVQRDAMGEHYLTVHQLGPILAVHVTALHLRDLTVICEEHLPAETTNQNQFLILLLRSHRLRQRKTSSLKGELLTHFLSH